MSLIQGQVASNVPSARASGNPNLLQAPFGEAWISELLPQYTSLAMAGKLYTAYAAAQATSVAGAAMVGLQVWNGSPISGSGAVNLIPLFVGGMIVVTSATQTGVLLAKGTGQVAAPSGQTAATSQFSNLIGSSNGAGLATNAGTFTNAPTAFMTLEHNTAAIAVTGEDPGYFFDLRGAYAFPPQTYFAFAALGAAGAASSNYHYVVWAEMPV